MHQFTENLLAGITITDILDILIVAYIFYKVLGFIRDSRAEQLLKGVLVLLAVAFIRYPAAARLELYYERRAGGRRTGAHHPVPAGAAACAGTHGAGFFVPDQGGPTG